MATAIQTLQGISRPVIGLGIIVAVLLLVGVTFVVFVNILPLDLAIPASICVQNAAVCIGAISFSLLCFRRIRSRLVSLPLSLALFYIARLFLHWAIFDNFTDLPPDYGQAEMVGMVVVELLTSAVALVAVAVVFFVVLFRTYDDA